RRGWRGQDFKIPIRTAERLQDRWLVVRKVLFRDQAAMLAHFFGDGSRRLSLVEGSWTEIGDEVERRRQIRLAEGFPPTRVGRRDVAVVREGGTRGGET